MPLTLSIVTAQRTVLERGDVTKLVVPASEGQITLLPSHAALMTALGSGEMLATVPGGVESIAIHGGFLQIVDDQVSVLADAAEHVAAIDLERAEAARARAEARLTGRDPNIVPGGLDVLRAQSALQRSMTRINIVRRRRSPTGVPSSRA
ncbi:MAG: ATP synthase F1 subunit epsilon [Dehalococcoidia bacterium]|nr:MAG: ATP synthase F1 subunit epsilon [Dehalococcoidia bacterium]